MIDVVHTEVGSRQGVITIRADGQEEVMSPAARTKALEEATKAGLSRPGLSGNDSAYPVDADGATGDEVLLGRRPVAEYRCDYHVTAGI